MQEDGPLAPSSRSILAWWHPLWNSSPLDCIDTHELCHGYRKSLDAFSKIIGSHLGPTKGLRMGKFCSNGKD